VPRQNVRNGIGLLESAAIGIKAKFTYLRQPLVTLAQQFIF